MKTFRDRFLPPVYTVNNRIRLQGRVRFPTGGTAHEPQGMIRCNSEADS